MAKCGGLSDPKEANEEIQDICDQVKQKIEEKLGYETTAFKAISYKTQVVAGTNYFVKIRVGEEKYTHARIFKDLPCNGSGIELYSIQGDKKKEDEIEYF